MHPAYNVEHGLTDWAREVLESRVYAVLSTINPDGTTHTVPVGFAFDGERFLVQSGTGSRKVRNVEGDPRVRVLVQAPTETMGQDGWVAADGRARIATGAEAHELNVIANARYLTQAGMAAYEEALAALMDVTIVVTPERWQSWIEAQMAQTLLDAGFTEEEMGGWFLPPDR